MNKDQVAGRVEEAKGKLKEVAGKVVGNEKLEGEGLADQAAGKVQKTYGDVKEKAKDAIKSGADKL
ncbi:CsbD family protein [Variovorax sp. VaC1]|uniref:CsbD family protein n=1 Tax=unclassified Variovorax TaxID=663243 RepID=UPI00374829C8